MFFWKIKLFLIHINSFKASLQSCHIKNNPNKSDIRNNPKRIKIRRSKRTFSFTSSKCQASICLEASLAFPLFIICLANICSICFLYMVYMDDLSNLHQQGKMAAAFAYTEDNIEEIRLQKNRKAEAAISFFAAWKYRVYTQCVVKPWTGYDVTKKHEQIKEEQMVYITDYGSVYHKNRSCGYLVPSVQAIHFQNIEEKRNQSGEEYVSCLLCKDPSFLTIVYVTDYGNKYHTTTKCRGLKRTVKSIPLSQVTGKDCCKKCG